MLSSLGFLLLAAVLRRAKYPGYTVAGQLLQFVTTEMIWRDNPSGVVIWTDRAVAAGNMLLLAREHHARGISKMTMGAALSATLIFKVVDWSLGVSPWYTCWHFNIVMNNVGLIYAYGPLPWYIYIMQHALCLGAWAVPFVLEMS